MRGGGNEEEYGGRGAAWPESQCWMRLMDWI